jgi:hypothetical protein
MTATSEGGLALSNENLLSDDTHAHNGMMMPPPLPPLKPSWRQLNGNLHHSNNNNQQPDEEESDAAEEEEEEEEAIPSDSLYGSRVRNGVAASSTVPDPFRMNSARAAATGARGGNNRPFQQPPPVGAELAHWSSHGYLAKDSPDSSHRPRESPASSGYVLLRRQGDQMVASANGPPPPQQQRGRLPPPPQQQALSSSANGMAQSRFGNNPATSGGSSPSPKFENNSGASGGHGSKYFSVKGLKHFGQLHQDNDMDAQGRMGGSSFMGDNKYFSVDSSFLSSHSDLRARLRQANGGGDGDADASRQPQPSSADNSLDFYKSHSPLQPPSSLDFPQPPTLPPYQRPPPPPPPSKPQAAQSSADSFAANGGSSLANSKNISGEAIFKRLFSKLF